MVKHNERWFECKENCVEKTEEILKSLERELGIKLHADYIGDVIHGNLACVYYHTLGFGHIRIRLYEEEETPILLPEEYALAKPEVKAKSKVIGSTPEEIRKAHTGHFKPHGLSEDKLAKILDIIRSVIPSAKEIPPPRVRR